jgi:hypothetical protein
MIGLRPVHQQGAAADRGRAQRLVEAAKAEDKPEYERFAEKLMAHALTEEEVSYPTALLIGRYLKATLAAGLSAAIGL